MSKQKTLFEGFPQEMIFESNNFCFRKCVQSFREKPLNPYERDCVYACVQNQLGLMLEIHNNKVDYIEHQRKLRLENL